MIIFGDWQNDESGLTVAEIFAIPKKKDLIELICKLFDRMNMSAEEDLVSECQDGDSTK